MARWHTGDGNSCRSNSANLMSSKAVVAWPEPDPGSACDLSLLQFLLTCFP
jgi:hypothetical protein